MFDYQDPNANEYEAEEIVDEKIINGKIFYMVKWIGYPHSQNTWEPEQHLANVPEYISYWNQKKRKLLKLNQVKHKKNSQLEQNFSYKPLDTKQSLKPHEVISQSKRKRGRPKKQQNTLQTNKLSQANHDQPIQNQSLSESFCSYSSQVYPKSVQNTNNLNESFNLNNFNNYYSNSNSFNNQNIDEKDEKQLNFSIQYKGKQIKKFVCNQKKQSVVQKKSQSNKKKRMSAQASKSCRNKNNNNDQKDLYKIYKMIDKMRNEKPRRLKIKIQEKSKEKKRGRPRKIGGQVFSENSEIDQHVDKDGIKEFNHNLARGRKKIKLNEKSFLSQSQGESQSLQLVKKRNQPQINLDLFQNRSRCSRSSDNSNKNQNFSQKNSSNKYLYETPPKNKNRKEKNIQSRSIGKSNKKLSNTQKSQNNNISKSRSKSKKKLPNSPNNKQKQPLIKNKNQKQSITITKPQSQSRLQLTDQIDRIEQQQSYQNSSVLQSSQSECLFQSSQNLSFMTPQKDIKNLDRNANENIILEDDAQFQDHYMTGSAISRCFQKMNDRVQQNLLQKMVIEISSSFQDNAKDNKDKDVVNLNEQQQIQKSVQTTNSGNSIMEIQNSQFLACTKRVFQDKNVNVNEIKKKDDKILDEVLAQPQKQKEKPAQFNHQKMLKEQQKPKTKEKLNLSSNNINKSLYMSQDQRVQEVSSDMSSKSYNRSKLDLCLSNSLFNIQITSQNQKPTQTENLKDNLNNNISPNKNSENQFKKSMNKSSSEKIDKQIVSNNVQQAKFNKKTDLQNKIFADDNLNKTCESVLLYSQNMQQKSKKGEKQFQCQNVDNQEEELMDSYSEDNSIFFFEKDKKKPEVKPNSHSKKKNYQQKLYKSQIVQFQVQEDVGDQIIQDKITITEKQKDIGQQSQKKLQKQGQGTYKSSLRKNIINRNFSTRSNCNSKMYEDMSSDFSSESEDFQFYQKKKQNQNANNQSFYNKVQLFNKKSKNNELFQELEEPISTINFKQSKQIKQIEQTYKQTQKDNQLQLFQSMYEQRQALKDPRHPHHKVAKQVEAFQNQCKEQKRQNPKLPISFCNSRQTPYFLQRRNECFNYFHMTRKFYRPRFNKYFRKKYRDAFGLMPRDKVTYDEVSRQGHYLFSKQKELDNSHLTNSRVSNSEVSEISVIKREEDTQNEMLLDLNWFQNQQEIQENNLVKPMEIQIQQQKDNLNFDALSLLQKLRQETILIQRKKSAKFTFQIQENNDQKRKRNNSSNNINTNASKKRQKLVDPRKRNKKSKINNEQQQDLLRQLDLDLQQSKEQQEEKNSTNNNQEQNQENSNKMYKLVKQIKDIVSTSEEGKWWQKDPKQYLKQIRHEAIQDLLLEQKNLKVYKKKTNIICQVPEVQQNIAPNNNMQIQYLKEQEIQKLDNFDLQKDFIDFLQENLQEPLDLQDRFNISKLIEKIKTQNLPNEDIEIEVNQILSRHISNHSKVQENIKKWSKTIENYSNSKKYANYQSVVSPKKFSREENMNYNTPKKTNKKRQCTMEVENPSFIPQIVSNQSSSDYSYPIKSPLQQAKKITFSQNNLPMNKETLLNCVDKEKVAKNDSTSKNSSKKVSQPLSSAIKQIQTSVRDYKKDNTLEKQNENILVKREEAAQPIQQQIQNPQEMHSHYQIQKHLSIAQKIFIKQFQSKKPCRIIKTVDSCQIIFIEQQFEYKGQRCFKVILDNNQRANARYQEVKANCSQILVQYYQRQMKKMKSHSSKRNK